MDTILFFAYYGLLLLFGILLSAFFSGVRLLWKNVGVCAVLWVACSIIQLIAYISWGEKMIWRIYPLIAHLPTVLLLCFYYRKRISTVLAAISTAYLCCQPAKWFGLLLTALTESHIVGQITSIIILIFVGFIAVYFLTPFVSGIYNKENHNVFIFGMVPMIYYLFDYIASIYTNFWTSNNRIVVEFLPFFLCCVHLLFCVVYYKEYEQKNDAERKAHMIHVTVEQQAKEIESAKRSEQEIRMLRHDMRLFLNNLSLYLAEDDIDAAQNMIAGYVRNVDSVMIHRYCKNTAVNYILSDCASKCRELGIEFTPKVEIDQFDVDESMFSMILSNALDNSINAQKELPEKERVIKLILKTSDNKLLLSVKNPYKKKPLLVDGMPVSLQKGHGYGTQSIRYLTERLGGNCQFSVDKNNFILRVII